MWKFHQYLLKVNRDIENITWPRGDTDFIFSC